MVALIIRGATIDGWCWAGAGHAVQCSAFRLRSVVTGSGIPLTCKESTTCYRCQLFHAIVAGFAVQRCPCWEDLGGGDEGLQKGVILGLIG